MITGDFNPVSTGFNANRVRQMTGLTLIISVVIRENYILDWCQTKKKDVDFEKIQLPPVGLSDHHTALIKSCTDRACRPSNDRVYKRDLRDSDVRHFGQWVTSFDWSVVLEIFDCNLKYSEFNVSLERKWTIILLDKGNSSARLFFADFPKGFDLADHNVIISEFGNLKAQPVIIR